MLQYDVIKRDLLVLPIDTHLYLFVFSAFLQGVFEWDAQAPERGAIAKETIKTEHHELFISLMCEREPAKVYSYLKNSDNYRAKYEKKTCNYVFVFVFISSFVCVSAFLL